MFPGLFLNKYVFGLISIIGIGSGLFLYGLHTGRAEIQEKQDKIEAAQRLENVLIEQRDSALADKKVQTITKIQTVTKTIHDEIPKIIDRPIYLNQCFDDDGLRLANAALTNSPIPAPSSHGAVPGPNTAK